MRYSLPTNALAALHYLDKGWTPIPVQPRDKRPAVAWKEFQTRPPSRSQIVLWWLSWPEANVALVTGRVSGVVVADLDLGKAHDLVDEFARRCGGALPGAPTVRTGSGLHLFFRHSGETVRNRVGLLPGLDLRGDAGFVVAPPSTHATGRPYRWLTEPSAPLPPLPEWLCAELVAPPVPQPWSEESGDIVPGQSRVIYGPGERNARLFKVACALAREWRGLALLGEVRAINAARCRPPLPDAEVEGIARNAERYSKS